jgi:phospholipid/cholesterol/gamma-HCH transport system permease protein
MPERDKLDFENPAAGILLARLSGNWTMQDGTPSAIEVERQIQKDPSIRSLTFDTTKLEDWDSGLLNFLTKVVDYCRQNNIDADRRGLPGGVDRIVELALTAPEKRDSGKQAVGKPFLVRIGEQTIKQLKAAGEMVDFIGEASLALAKFMRGKANYRRSDLILLIQDSGVQALPIITLISLLVGLILAFVGAIQLKMFGAQIYVADLVGIAMAREMGAMMSAIVMAGRTGAAFAAQIGAMQVNEEIDAFKTLGISPMEFLVVPRVVALTLMLPLLCLYADCVGILGGVIVGVEMLDLSFAEYWNETVWAVSLTDFYIGLAKSAVFGALVASSGCLRGMQCGRSASAVGVATTSAVVTAIVLIIVFDAIITVITNRLGI